MARGLKSNGLEEVKALRQRVIRQYNLERISRTDHEILVELLDKFAAHVVRMKEVKDDDEYEKEL